MHTGSQSGKRKHHTHRKTQRLWMLCVLVAVVVALVAGFFWLMSSPQFAMPR